MDYGMPHADMVPSFTTGIAEVLSPTNPLGIKAGGEGGTTAAPAAVVSALLDALRGTGVRDLPMPATPYAIWSAIQKARRVPRASGPGFMTPPILALERISKRFGAIVIAADLDLALGEGEALGIIGPNGAGKTTLFGIISGTIAPDAGRVLYRGADITGLPPARRCTMGIGRSFQIPQPFGGMSVFENLVVAAAFGARRHERDAYASCMAILERCGLADKANRPAGSLALLDRKRLELARALATEPAVLLLDEVAGGLTERECHAPDRTDPRCQDRRRIDHLDRACRARPDRQHRSARRPAQWRDHRRGRSGDGHSQPRGGGDLSGDRGGCLSRSSPSLRSTLSMATSRRCSASASKSAAARRSR